MIDEHVIRKDLTHFELILYELEECKTLSAKRPDIRVMDPSFRPQAPGNERAMSLDGEIQPDVRAWCFTFFGSIDDPKPIPPWGTPTVGLVEWLLMYPYYLAMNPDAESFYEELSTWIRKVEKIVGREKDAAELAAKPEARYDSSHIVRRMSTRGWVITKDQVRKWAERGHITRVDRAGKGTYLLTEVIQYLSGREVEAGLPKTL